MSGYQPPRDVVTTLGTILGHSPRPDDMPARRKQADDRALREAQEWLWSARQEAKDAVLDWLLCERLDALRDAIAGVDR